MNNKLKAKEITNYFIGWLRVRKPTTDKKHYNEYVKEVIWMIEND